MKTCLLALLLACLGVPAHAATWNAFREPISYQEATLFDSDSVVKSGDRVTVLFESLQDAESEMSRSTYRKRVHMTFDCKARTVEELDTSYASLDGQFDRVPAGDHHAYPVPRLGSPATQLDAACTPTFPKPQPQDNYLRIPANNPDAYAAQYFDNIRAEFRGMRRGPPRDPPAARLDCAGAPFKFSTALKDLPPEVLALLTRDGPIAEHGKDFNATDVVLDRLPSRRLASAALGEQRAFVAVEHGGMGYNVEVWAFDRQSGRWNGKQRWLTFDPPASLPALLSTTCRQNAPAPRADRPARPKIACSVDNNRSIYVSYADVELSFSYTLDRHAVAQGLRKAGRIKRAMSAGDQEPSPDEAAEAKALLEAGRRSPDNECPPYLLDEFMRALAGHDQPWQAPGTAQGSPLRTPSDAARGEAKEAAKRANDLAFRHEDKQAIAELDRALRLDPALTEARHTRAWLRFNNDAQGHERELAVQDLAIVDKELPPDSELRMSMGFIYQRFDMPEQEIAQWNQWIPVHGGDSALSSAYSGRCGARVTLNIELDKAIADCAEAIAISERNHERHTAPFKHRGWVWLRLGQPDKSLADFNHVLALDADDAWAYYGRGVAHRQLRQDAAAKADFAAARRRILNIDSLMEKAGMTFAPGAKPGPWHRPGG